MNSKIKKLISILILIVVVVSSLTYYENSTEPQGLQGICNGMYAINYSHLQNLASGLPKTTQFLYSDNVSYLGNKADLMLWIDPVCDIFNLSIIKNQSYFSGNIAWTRLFISNESYAPLYSHLLISVTNFSMAFNKTMFYNASTNKGDVFGNTIELYPRFGFSGNTNEYYYNFGEDNINHNGPQFTNLIIPGNYTIYENITFTITVSLGILHFTSQEYSIHKSWWELWAYNDQPSPPKGY